MHVRSFYWAVVLVTLFGGILVSAAHSASTIYWCPDRKSDQEYSAEPGPGCLPLVEKKVPGRDAESDVTTREPRDYQIENLQHDVKEFLSRYRRFLECCKTDLAELQELEELGQDVDDLLNSAQAKLSNYSMASRGIMLRELIQPVVKARADLKTLRAQLEKIDSYRQRRDQLDFEETGREHLKVQEIEESIEKDIRAPRLPESAKTGTSIGVAPATGPNIGRSTKTGSEIGRGGLTGQEIGVSPRSGRDIGGNGPTGFQIGATGRPGPSIGESSLNQDTSSRVNSSLQHSTVGSDISDSTVGSSLGSSNIGSTLQDTSVGSSFGGSSVGSSLQNR